MIIITCPKNILKSSKKFLFETDQYLENLANIDGVMAQNMNGDKETTKRVITSFVLGHG